MITMSATAALRSRLAPVSDLTVLVEEPLARHTRFGIGGPATLFCDATTEMACVEALRIVESAYVPLLVMGGGTNLVVSDEGFDGVVVRFSGSRIQQDGTLLRVQSGALLQDVVDQSIRLGLEGAQTMTGIPGFLGGAVYGNAGAYGHSIQELVELVHATDGRVVIPFRNEECRFRYRDSIFKDRKEWTILSADLRFTPGDAAALAQTATGIRTVRDAKYPPTMRCAGSIFKNLFFADLPPTAQLEVPPTLVREGKVPSAWFLEQVGVKGLRRGDIQVADYHANLIYNDGQGTASDLVWVIEELKQRVRARFAFELEEEVQYVGFEEEDAPPAA